MQSAVVPFVPRCLVVQISQQNPTECKIRDKNQGLGCFVAGNEGTTQFCSYAKWQWVSEGQPDTLLAPFDRRSSSIWSLVVASIKRNDIRNCSALRNVNKEISLWALAGTHWEENLCSQCDLWAAIPRVNVQLFLPLCVFTWSLRNELQA